MKIIVLLLILLTLPFELSVFKHNYNVRSEIHLVGKTITQNLKG